LTFVELINDDPRASSLIISDGMKQSHRATLILIDKYAEQLKDLGTFSFEMRKSAGRPQRVAWLNEQQTLFLCSLMRNSKIVVEFKKRVAGDFVKMKNAILEIKTRQKNSEWIETRRQGKISRKSETDIIKDFVEYATSQGSKSAKMYYTNITKMENKALFVVSQKFKNLRNILDGQQLAVINTCDQLVSKSIRDGMKDNLHYKGIYKKAKSDVLNLVDLIGMSYVPNQKTITDK